MEESVDLHEEAGKENEQTLANLSPAEEATSKDEVEIEKFLQKQKSKILFGHIINILLTELGRSSCVLYNRTEHSQSFFIC